MKYEAVNAGKLSCTQHLTNPSKHRQMTNINGGSRNCRMVVDRWTLDIGQTLGAKGLNSLEVTRAAKKHDARQRRHAHRRGWNLEIKKKEARMLWIEMLAIMFVLVLESQ